MPNNDYTYFAFCGQKNHYAENLTCSIDSPLSTIMAAFYKHTYQQRFPAVFKYAFEETFKYSARSIYVDNPTRPARVSHGAAHASRVAIASVLFFNLYENYGTQQTRDELSSLISSLPGNNFQEKRTRFTKLLQIAAAFHDAGRLGDGADRDEWEKQGANDCRLFLETLLKKSSVSESQATQLATLFSDAIYKKDATLNAKKPLINSFIQCADCLEIMRCKRSFSINYLDIWNDAFGMRDTLNTVYIDPKHRLELQKELVYLAFEWRELIHFQGSLRNTSALHVSRILKHSDVFRKDKKSIAIDSGASRHYDATQPYEMVEFSTVENTLADERFSFLRRYYESSTESVRKNFTNTNATHSLFKPMDEAISAYVRALDNPLFRDYHSIDRIVLAMIQLRQTLKARVINNKADDITTLVQNETVRLINALSAFRACSSDKEKIHHAINHYHQKLAHLLNTKHAMIAAAIVFTITAATLLVLSFNILIPALVIGYPIVGLQTLFHVYLAIIAPFISLPIAGYGAYRTFHAIANKEGISSSIRKLEEQIQDGEVIRPLLFPESSPPLRP